MFFFPPPWERTTSPPRKCLTEFHHRPFFLPRFPFSPPGTIHILRCTPCLGFISRPLPPWPDFSFLISEAGGLFFFFLRAKTGSFSLSLQRHSCPLHFLFHEPFFLPNGGPPLGFAFFFSQVVWVALEPLFRFAASSLLLTAVCFF